MRSDPSNARPPRPPRPPLETFLENVYAGTHDYFKELWAAGVIDRNAFVPHSSQSLCVSVFGGLRGLRSRGRIMQRILGAAGISGFPGTGPAIDCEERSGHKLLNEYGGAHPTCPDALARWDRNAVLIVESKFTERFGPCSQPKTKACNGNYAVGSDLLGGTAAPCRLTVEHVQVVRGRTQTRTARKYWEISSRLFRPQYLVVGQEPCPLKDGRYQLMRNLTYAQAYADRDALPLSGFLVAYCSRASNARHSEADFARFCSMLKPELDDRVGMISYEVVAEILRDAGERTFADWLDDKLYRVVGATRS